MFISVDTSKPEVMRAACAAGADIINDVRALREPGALARGRTHSRRHLPHAHEGRAAHHAGRACATTTSSARSARFWLSVSRRAVTAGIESARLAVDPGFGFGKRIVDNLALLKHLGQLRELGVPLAVGLSRKSMLAKITGRDVDDRTAGSVALAAIAVLNGARIVRAHDVAATVDAVRVAAAVVAGRGFRWHVSISAPTAFAAGSANIR